MCKPGDMIGLSSSFLEVSLKCPMAGCVRVKDVDSHSDSESLHSGRALSQALASLSLPGDRLGWIIKCVSGAEEQESRDETEERDGWEIPSKILRKGRRRKGETLSRGPQLRGVEIWSEGSYLLFEKPSSPTHSWTHTVPQSAVENRGF